MNINDYIGQDYGPQGCWAMVAHVYSQELDVPVTQFRTVNSSIRAIATAFRLALEKNPDGFVQIDAPAEMCVVLLARLKGMDVHHCGVYVDGGVLHALETGVVYEGMDTLGDAYQVVEFWARAA